MMPSQAGSFCLSVLPYLVRSAAPPGVHGFQEGERGRGRGSTKRLLPAFLWLGVCLIATPRLTGGREIESLSFTGSVAGKELEKGVSQLTSDVYHLLCSQHLLAKDTFPPQHNHSLRILLLYRGGKIGGRGCGSKWVFIFFCIYHP